MFWLRSSSQHGRRHFAIALDIQDDQPIATVSGDHNGLCERCVGVLAEVPDEISTGDATHRVQFRLEERHRRPWTVYTALRNSGIFQVFSSSFTAPSAASTHRAAEE